MIGMCILCFARILQASDKRERDDLVTMASFVLDQCGVHGIEDVKGALCVNHRAMHDAGSARTSITRHNQGSGTSS